MRSKILRIIQTSMLLVGLCALSGCFERQYYSSPGYGYGPAYSSYGYGPAYYPREYSYAPAYRPVYRPAYRYDGGGRAWIAHERAEHEEHEEHEHHEHHHH
jgi:hypothetical protein